LEVLKTKSSILCKFLQISKKYEKYYTFTHKYGEHPKLCLIRHVRHADRDLYNLFRTIYTQTPKSTYVLWRKNALIRALLFLVS